MEDILILAGSDQELIDRYLDKEKNAPDYAQLKELEEKHGRGYGLTDTVYAQLKRRLFQSALKNFVSRVCQEQRDLCEQGFWEAECGDEAEFICQAPMPDLVTDIEVFRFSSSGFTIKVISRLLTPYSLANLRWLMPVVAYRKAISDFCSGVSFCRRSYCDPRMIIFSLLYGMSLHC